MNPDQPDPNSHGPARRAVLLGLGALTLAGCGQPADVEDRDLTPTDTAPAPTRKASSAAEKVVTMLGDSITAGYGLPAAAALPAQLEAELKAAGLSVQVRAAGVSGDTSAGGLSRVDFSVEDDTDLCIVALGGNDMLQGIDPATLRTNLQSIIDKLKARHIPVLLAGMMAPPQYGSYAVDFDRVFVDLAKQEGVAAYPFLLKGVALDRRYNQTDGIHPNAEGVKIIAEGLAPVVAKALKA